MFWIMIGVSVSIGLNFLYAMLGIHWMIAICIVLFALWFRVIPADVSALKIRMEKPVEGKVYTKTWAFAFWPFEKFVYWTREQVFLDFEPQKVISGRKKVSFPQGGGEKVYSQANIEVDSAMYFNWPEEYDELVDAYEKGPDPGNEEAIKKHLQDYVISIIRERMGEISWMEAKQGWVFLEIEDPNDSTKTIKIRKTLNEFILEALVDPKKIEDDEGGITSTRISNPIFQAKMQDVRVVITDVALPEALQAAISLPEIAEYQGTATKIKAAADKERDILDGDAKAANRKKIYEAIQGSGAESTQLEVLYTLREMAQGTSNTILYGLPPNVANLLKEKTGMEMTDEQLGKIVSAAISALEKTKKQEG